MKYYSFKEHFSLQPFNNVQEQVVSQIRSTAIWFTSPALTPGHVQTAALSAGAETLKLVAWRLLKRWEGGVRASDAPDIPGRWQPCPEQLKGSEV